MGDENQEKIENRDTQETSVVQDMKTEVASNPVADNAKTKSKQKWIIVIIVIAVLLLVLATIGLLIWKPWEKGGENSRQPEQADNSVDSNSPTEENTNNNEAGNESVVIDEIDAEAKELYERFVDRINNPEESLWTFRFNEGMKTDQPDRYLMLTLAAINVGRTPCNQEHINPDFGGYVVESCYNGEAVRKEVERLFGQKLQFTAEDRVRQICGGNRYDPSSDEFVEVGDGCGFASPERLVSILTGVERSGDKLYLYEKVLLANSEYPGGIGIQHVDESDEFIGVVEDASWDNGYEAYWEEMNAKLSEQALQNGDEFKWTFRKTDSGNYVFEKIEEL